MTKQTIYVYLGTNGTIESPVHLEDIYYVRKAKLFADPGKILTNGQIKRSTVTVPEEEIGEWEEIPILV